MKIRYIETRQNLALSPNDIANRMLLIVIDDSIEIRVLAYGSPEWTIWVGDAAGSLPTGRILQHALETAAAKAIPKDKLTVTPKDVRRLLGITLGMSCTPETIAHVVLQTLGL